MPLTLWVMLPSSKSETTSADPGAVICLPARLASGGSLPSPADLVGSPEVPPSHATYVPVSSRDTFQAFCAAPINANEVRSRTTFRFRPCAATTR